MDDMKPYCERLSLETDEALRDSSDCLKVSETASAIFKLIKREKGIER